LPSRNVPAAASERVGGTHGVTSNTGTPFGLVSVRHCPPDTPEPEPPPELPPELEPLTFSYATGTLKGQKSCSLADVQGATTTGVPDTVLPPWTSKQPLLAIVEPT
jgi:hypothetical protein